MSIAGFLGGVGGSVANTASNPAFEVMRQTANRAMPVNRPDWQNLIKLYYQGLLSDRGLVEEARIEGYLVQGFNLSSTQFFVERNGILVYTGVPFQADINGRIIQGSQPNLDLTMVLSLYNRKLIDENAASAMLQLLGFAHTGLIGTILQTRFAVPNPSDLVKYAVREAFDPATIIRYGYHKNFPRQILPHMEAQGLGYSMGFQRPAGATDNNGQAMVGDVTAADLEWYSHWDVPATGQGYEMLHRLYSNSPHGRSPLAVNDITFDLPDLETLQQVNDIPEYWRKRLAAISYLPLTRVDVRRMFNTNIITADEVYHQYRAGGYDDKNAEGLLQFAIKDKYNYQASIGLELSIKEVKTAFLKGVIPEREASGYLQRMNYTRIQSERILANWTIILDVQRIEGKVKIIKSNYFHGSIDANETSSALRELGLVPEYVTRVISDWVFELQHMEKMPSMKLNLEWFSNGLISERDLEIALQNLGYRGADLTNIITNAKLKINVLTGKNLAKLQQNQVKQGKERAKVSKEKDKIIAKGFQDVIKTKEAEFKDATQAWSEKNVLLWYQSEYIDIDMVYKMMNLTKGWSKGDVDRWVSSQPAKAKGGSDGKAPKDKGKQEDSSNDATSS